MKLSRKYLWGGKSLMPESSSFVPYGVLTVSFHIVGIQ